MTQCHLLADVNYSFQKHPRESDSHNSLNEGCLSYPHHSSQCVDKDALCGSPILINPNNPIKDPGKFHVIHHPLVTKKRVRQCGNRYCCSPPKTDGDYKKWSRRKLKSGQFIWWCELCSDAYKKG